MKKHRKKTSLLFFIFLGCLITLLLLVFMFGLNEEKDDKEGEIISLDRNYVFEDLENYIIEKNKEEQIIINENVKLFFVAPLSLSIEKKILKNEDKEEKLLIFTPSDYKESENKSYEEEKCEIHFTIYKEESYYNHLKNKINDVLLNDKSDAELVEVDNTFGVVYETEDRIIIRIPKKEKIYEVGARFLNDAKDCKEKYYALINTVILDYD